MRTKTIKETVTTTLKYLRSEIEFQPKLSGVGRRSIIEKM